MPANDVSVPTMSETIADIVAAHRSGAASPEQTDPPQLSTRIRAHGDPAVFISLREEEDAVAEARALMAAGPDGKPLYGVPIAVKDNIDVAGLPTTAACPAFAYNPLADATAVTRARLAGAIVIGKTNLDQFATGLVGVRSPYGMPRNPFRDDLISGGSSSGSAVAVAAGLVPVALGTDTAGSGRVPAGLNNIVGLKPSAGLVSTTGLVPACRSLDCVSIFTLTVDDAFTVLQAMTIPDMSDPYSRVMPLGKPGAVPPSMVIAVPDSNGRLFFGDADSEQSFRTAIALLRNMGAKIEEIDIFPLLETARLLYEGPWVAERYAAVGAFIEKNPDKVHPVTREIILGGAKSSAAEAFRAFYRLAALRRTAFEMFSRFDALMVPTVPAAYTRVADRSRSDSTQQQSRHLYQFREPARFVRARSADFFRQQRHAVWRDVPYPLWTRCDTCESWPRRARADRIAAWRARGEATNTEHAGADDARGRNHHRRGRRASFRHAAERRIARAQCPFRGRGGDRAGLQTLCAGRHDPAEARTCCALRMAMARRSHSKSGRCRQRILAASFRRFPRRFRSERSGFRMDAWCRASWSSRKRSTAHAIFLNIGGWRAFVERQRT